MLVSVLAESVVLGAIGGLIGGIGAYLAFNGFQTSTMNFQTFSQVAFAFRVTPQLLGDGLGLCAVDRTYRRAASRDSCRKAADSIGVERTVGAG